jgi:hypothetical protein
MLIIINNIELTTQRKGIVLSPKRKVQKVGNIYNL